MKKGTLKPLSDRIIVRKLPAETTTPGGIIVKEPLEKHEKGYIIAVGPGRMGPEGLVKMTVKPGDAVLFENGIGQPFKLKGEDVLLMYEGDVIGIFT